MRTPAIPHYGTTLAEAPPPPGVSQADAPLDGMLGATDRFLRLAGFELAVRNLYPGIGRQYIYRRGQPSDADYLEKDSFTSYAAQPPPASAAPRVGETIFRLPHRDPRALYRAWRAEQLATPLLGADAEAAFLAGEAPALLLRGPDTQRYELTPSAPARLENFAVYVWTDPARLAETIDAYAKQFAIEPVGAAETFHGIAALHRLVRREPAVTIGLLTPLGGAPLAPRWRDDIFQELGYSHFRLGSPDKAAVIAQNPEAYPATGDVSYVLFRESYLELVQV
jgi:hypothetical protein